jgi:hypothetical protein
MCQPISRRYLYRVPADLRKRLLDEAKVRERLEGRSISDHYAIYGKPQSSASTPPVRARPIAQQLGRIQTHPESYT